MEDIKKLTGVANKTQLAGFVSDIVKLLHDEDAKVVNGYKALVGELGNKPLGEGETEAVAHTVKSYVDAAVAAINIAAGSLEARVKGNEDAITLLNNTKDVIGSIKYMMEQRLVEFLAEVTDNNKIDTIKETFDWINTHQGEYQNLAALVGKLPEDAGVTTVVAYAKALVEAAEARIKVIEDDYLKAADKTELEGKIGGLDTRLAEVEAKFEGDESVEALIAAAKAEAIEAVQGETEATVKDLVDAMNSQAYLTDAEVAEIKALIV